MIFTIAIFAYAKESAIETFKSYFAEKKGVSTAEQYADMTKKYWGKSTIEALDKLLMHWDDSPSIENAFDVSELEIGTVTEYPNVKNYGDMTIISYSRKGHNNIWGKATLVKEGEAWKMYSDFLTSKYIPSNIEECFNELKKDLTPEKLEEFKNKKEESLAEYHFGWGMQIRNDWGLRAGSRLAEYFRKMGVTDPDEMSSIILCSFHRYLNNQDIRLEEQVKDH